MARRDQPYRPHRPPHRGPGGPADGPPARSPGSTRPSGRHVVDLGCGAGGVAARAARGPPRPDSGRGRHRPAPGQRDARSRARRRRPARPGSRRTPPPGRAPAYPQPGRGDLRRREPRVRRARRHARRAPTATCDLGGAPCSATPSGSSGPSTAAQQALGARPGDFPTLAQLVTRFGEHGFEVGYAHVSSAEEWDDYEWSWTGSLVARALRRRTWRRRTGAGAGRRPHPPARVGRGLPR